MPPSTLPASAYEALELPVDTVETLIKSKSATDTPSSTASAHILEAKPAPATELKSHQSSITLYAELLLNIRTVTLFASLQTVQTRETRAELSADGSCITVSHEGESATIHLPIKAKAGGDATLTLPAQPWGKELTLRLQIQEQDGSDFLAAVQAEERKANLVPWDGASLNSRENVEVQCKQCQTVLVPAGNLKEWRDLPNENWAEMMDFWHCHKPDEHHLHDHTHESAIEKKGYAAGNRLTAVLGLGFVDLASLLLAEADCQGVQSSPSQPDTLTCKHCTHPLGTPDPSANGFRLWKWNISIPSSTQPSPPTYKTQKWISARLLSLIENLGLRKFHVHPPLPATSSADRDGHASGGETTSTPSILLWVFTPDLLFSSSTSPSTATSSPSSPSPPPPPPIRAMKIFYQHQTYHALRPGDRESASVEEVTQPKDVYTELETVLRESGNLLPGNARTFREWQVGLLERFDVGEVG